MGRAHLFILFTNNMGINKIFHSKVFFVTNLLKNVSTSRASRIA